MRKGQSYMKAEKSYEINGKKYRIKKTTYKDWKKILKLLSTVQVNEDDAAEAAAVLFEGDVLIELMQLILADESGAAFADDDFPDTDIATVMKVITEFFEQKKSLIEHTATLFSNVKKP